MGFLQDISPILKKRELVLVDKIKEGGSLYTFIFEKDNDLTWKAGQHGVFSITHKKIKKPTRPFSIASSPSENVVKISMEISDDPSEFKKALLELEKGMKVNMRGPIGPMHVDRKSPILLVAGGIGITPFRSILKDLENYRNEELNQIDLLYIDSKGNFLYRSDFDELAKSISLNVSYLTSREDLYKKIDDFSIDFGNTGKYYVAGRKTMVDEVVAHLKNHHIAKENVKKDVFLGYK